MGETNRIQSWFLGFLEYVTTKNCKNRFFRAFFRGLTGDNQRIGIILAVPESVSINVQFDLSCPSSWFYSLLLKLLLCNAAEEVRYALPPFESTK